MSYNEVNDSRSDWMMSYNEVVVFSKNSSIEIKYDKKINIAESILKFIAKVYSTKISLVKSNVK